MLEVKQTVGEDRGRDRDDFPTSRNFPGNDLWGKWGMTISA